MAKYLYALKNVMLNFGRNYIKTNYNVNIFVFLTKYHHIMFKLHTRCRIFFRKGEVLKSHMNEILIDFKTKCL